MPRAQFPASAAVQHLMRPVDGHRPQRQRTSMTQSGTGMHKDIEIQTPANAGLNCNDDEDD